MRMRRKPFMYWILGIFTVALQTPALVGRDHCEQGQEHQRRHPAGRDREREQGVVAGAAALLPHVVGGQKKAGSDDPESAYNHPPLWPDWAADRPRDGAKDQTERRQCPPSS